MILFVLRSRGCTRIFPTLNLLSLATMLLGRDRNRHGGAPSGIIIIFVRDILSCTILSTPISSSIELLSLTVEFCSSKFCISTFYRPPSSDVSYFDELYDIIEKLDL